MTALLVGAYGPDMGGSSRGIATAVSDAVSSVALAPASLECASPSWLAVRGDRLVATLEGTGELAWFARAGDAWVPDGVVATGGASPCHAAFLDDDAVAVACYGDGAVVVVEHGADRPLQRLDGEGSGPLPAQEGPHAHHVLVLADGRVLTVDLGADRLHVHRRADDGGLERIRSLVLPAGTGPRDLHVLPEGRLLLLGEWSCELLVLEPDGESFRVAQSLALPGATRGEDQASALGLSIDGRFVYAGVRGANRIAVVAIGDGGVSEAGWVSSEGEWPRHLLVDGGLLHVANQLSDSLATFRLDDDGMPRFIGSASVPSPTRIVKSTADPLLS